jgi:hypothetical protein
MKVFCIDGVIVDTDYEPTREDLESQVFMPIENQPIMAGLLAHEEVPLLTPLTASSFIDRFGGRMLEDRNTEMMRDVADALCPDHIPTDWP